MNGAKAFILQLIGINEKRAKAWEGGNDMKEYIKPSVDYFSLTVEEVIASGSVCVATGYCKREGVLLIEGPDANHISVIH